MKMIKFELNYVPAFNRVDTNNMAAKVMRDMMMTQRLMEKHVQDGTMSQEAYTERLAEMLLSRFNRFEALDGKGEPVNFMED